MIRALLLLLLFSTFTCTSIAQKSGKAPKWIEKPYSVYDKANYLLAIGSGSDAQSAQNNGMMNLSRIFQAVVKADQGLFEEIREISKNGKLVSVNEASELINNIKIGTNQEIKNAKLLETYSESDGTVSVLVGIERRPTALLYKTEIENNEAEISYITQKANDESNPLRKLTKLQQALVLAKINTTLLAQKAVILEQPVMSEESASLTNTKDLVEQQKRKTLVFIDSNGISSEIRASLIESFQKEGFELADDSTKAVIYVHSTYDAQAIDLGRDDAKFVKWTLVVHVQDKFENRDFFTYQAENRDGSLTQKEAFIRAEYNAKRKLIKEFGKNLTNHILTY